MVLRARPLIAAAALALALPAGASAATTVGSDLTATNLTNHSCVGPTCTLAQESIGSRATTSPIDGVVVRWRVKSNSSTNVVAFRVIRPAGPPNYTGAGTSAPFTIPTPGVINTVPTRLPIRKGDLIGLDYKAGSDPLVINQVALAGTTMRLLDTGVADGGAPALASTQPWELMLNADIEPDVDHDGYGDETQDQCPTDPTTHGPCPSNTTKPPPTTTTTGTLTASLKLGGTLRLKKALKSGIATTLTSNEAATARASITISRSDAKKLGLGKRFIVGTGRATLTKAGRVKLTARFSRRAKAKLAKLGRGIRVLVTVQVHGGSGNVVNLGKRVKLKA